MSVDKLCVVDRQCHGNVRRSVENYLTVANMSVRWSVIVDPVNPVRSTLHRVCRLWSLNSV